MRYECHLANFDGPLDLLLHLVSRAKIELKDIFVSEITEQYLSYMSQTDKLDMDTASEFLQMAATLLYIKSRSLLPEKRREEEIDEEGLTPEEQLIRRLNEYKRFKQVSEELAELSQRAKGRYYKLPEEIIAVQSEGELGSGDVDALRVAYLKVLERIRRQEEPPRDVVIEREVMSVRKQVRVILARLSIKPSMEFEELLSARPTRMELAVTFVALLELLNQEKVFVRQQRTFDQIHIERRAREHG